MLGVVVVGSENEQQGMNRVSRVLLDLDHLYLMNLGSISTRYGQLQISIKLVLMLERFPFRPTSLVPNMQQS